MNKKPTKKSGVTTRNHQAQNITHKITREKVAKRSREEKTDGEEEKTKRRNSAEREEKNREKQEEEAGKDGNGSENDEEEEEEEVRKGRGCLWQAHKGREEGSIEGRNERKNKKAEASASRHFRLILFASSVHISAPSPTQAHRDHDNKSNKRAETTWPTFSF